MHSEQVKDDLVKVVASAYAEGQRLAIHGGRSKAFYGFGSPGSDLDTRAYRGIVNYEPTELVVTVRAGTPLVELEAVLDERKQMLAFEPPAFASEATIGGTLACGFSGPRRPYVGAARDFVLGLTCINGKGQYLRFGGQVMKNVAGFDVSRLMIGAMGTLGVMLDISIKVLPRPAMQLTLSRTVDAGEALMLFNEWSRKSCPLTGACHFGDRLYARLEGAGSAVERAARLLGGEELVDGKTFWCDLNDQRLSFFANSSPLWRLSVPAATPEMSLDAPCLIDWGGAQRWVFSNERSAVLEAARSAGGHAVRFRGGEGDVFVALPERLAELHRRIKQAFDPRGILNVGRIYSSL